MEVEAEGLQQGSIFEAGQRLHSCIPHTGALRTEGGNNREGPGAHSARDIVDGVEEMKVVARGGGGKGDSTPVGGLPPV